MQLTDEVMFGQVCVHMSPKKCLVKTDYKSQSLVMKLVTKNHVISCKPLEHKVY